MSSRALTEAEQRQLRLLASDLYAMAERIFALLPPLRVSIPDIGDYAQAAGAGAWDKATKSSHFPETEHAKIAAEGVIKNEGKIPQQRGAAAAALGANPCKQAHCRYQPQHRRTRWRYRCALRAAAAAGKIRCRVADLHGSENG